MKICLIKQPAGIGDVFFCQKIARYMMHHGYQVVWPLMPSISWIKDYIKVIDLETSYDDRHLSGADHDTIVKWLSERGFELKEMSDSYQHQNWGDSVFARVDRELPPFIDENVGTKLYGENYL